MEFIYVFGALVLIYFVSKTLNAQLEAEKEDLQRELVFVKTQKQQERKKYEERISMMNDAFDQFKKN